MSKYSSYVLYLLISIFTVILYANRFGPLDSMQRGINDSLAGLAAPDEAPANVVLVTIDEKTQQAYGEWPWHYDRVADLAAACYGAEPKALVLDFPIPEDARQDSAGYTAILAEQLSWMPRAILKYDIALGTFRSRKTTNPEYLFNNTVTVESPLGDMDEHAALNVRKVFLPAERLLGQANNLGFDYLSPDDDSRLRHYPLIMNYEGYYYPSVPLLAAAVAMGYKTSDVKVIEGKEVHLGHQAVVPVNEQTSFYVSFVRDNQINRISAADVLAEGFDFSRLKDRVVYVGLSDPRFTESFLTNGSEATSEMDVRATATANLLEGNLLRYGVRQPGVDILILFLLGGGFAALLPRLILKWRMVIIGSAVVALVATSLVSLFAFNVLPETIYIALYLAFCMIASPLLDSQLMAAGMPEKAQAKKKQARAVSAAQAKKEIEAAPVRELVDQPNNQTNLPTRALGKDEIPMRDHQAINLDGPEIVGPDSYQAQETSALSDSASEIEAAPAMSDSGESWKRSGESGPLNESPSLRAQAEQLADVKSLGRYQISGILGKGAMGTVYKGIDPAINRPVALKTIRLDFVNDPAELEELKERLYREAQAAGKLSHPNIVTIYDVGSEGPLQYIAMEYLEGTTLESLIKKKTKFNYRIIAQIIMQICDALDYAHERGIVHRDIKPANVMVLADYRIKVMDFGIARIDSNSMTKTGIAMGTPNYISPEQLRGLAIDRRADLFSLGVVMYEMLLGRRPFKGENITSLIYSILHQEPEKPSIVNPQIPLLFDHIIARSLRKVPGERYQKASEISADLHDFVRAFAKA